MPAPKAKGSASTVKTAVANALDCVVFMVQAVRSKAQYHTDLARLFITTPSAFDGLDAKYVDKVRKLADSLGTDPAARFSYVRQQWKLLDHPTLATPLPLPAEYSDAVGAEMILPRTIAETFTVNEGTDYAITVPAGTRVPSFQEAIILGERDGVLVSAPTKGGRSVAVKSDAAESKTRQKSKRQASALTGTPEERRAAIAARLGITPTA